MSTETNDVHPMMGECGCTDPEEHWKKLVGAEPVEKKYVVSRVQEVVVTARDNEEALERGEELIAMGQCENYACQIDHIDV